MAEHDELPELNQKWFDKRFSAIRGPNVRQAEVELRCLIREVHVALRFREVKAAARRRNDVQRGATVSSPKPTAVAVPS